MALQISSPGIRGRLWPAAYLLEACFLARRMKFRKVGHLHNHLGQNSAAVAMLASVLTDTPYSLTIHGPAEFDLPLTLALDEKIARSKFTVAISHFGRGQLMRWCPPQHWNKIHVIHCGLLREFLPPNSTNIPDVERIVYTARLVRDKGHLVLIEAVARLVKQGVKVELVLIGDGPLRSDIETAILAHRIKASVRLLGNQSSAEVRKIIESSRGFVSPSFAEGLPVSIMEAMALGRPVISTNVGAVSELIEHGKHGWLIPAGSIEDLTLAMREMLDEPIETLAIMGRRCREQVFQHHDARREVLKLAALI